MSFRGQNLGRGTVPQGKDREQAQEVRKKSHGILSEVECIHIFNVDGLKTENSRER
jgi:hypothetical protein